MNDVLTKERDLLKTELQALKHCQVQYFSFMLIGTGAILGLAEKYTQSAVPGLPYLAPLVIIIPFWTIFFDKATTISRIIGYYRILERLIIGDTRYRYVGWENALKLFRKTEMRGRINFIADLRRMVMNAGRAVPVILNMRREHRYWVVNWIAFFALGAFCLFLCWKREDSPSCLWWVSAFLFVLCVLHNADVLWTLIKGECSYDSREDLWAETLATDSSPG